MIINTPTFFGMIYFNRNLPARSSDEGCSSDRENGRVLMVIVLDAFEPLQVHNAKHGQSKAEPKEYQTYIEPPTARIQRTRNITQCSFQAIHED